MDKVRSYYYLLDKLTPERAQMIKRAMEMVSEVRGIVVGLPHGVIEVRATKDPGVQMKMACEIAGTTFRLQVKRHHLYSARGAQ